MLIPEDFNLGAVEWNIVLKERLINDDMGSSNTGSAQISISTSNCRSVVEQTYCHELVHAILFAMGKRAVDHDEVFVDGFAVFLHQYLVQHEQALVTRET